MMEHSISQEINLTLSEIDYYQWSLMGVWEKENLIYGEKKKLIEMMSQLKVD